MTNLNVNGQLLRHYREARSWTQLQLAQRAGYSERLVRKAEAGGSLAVETLGDLATALSSDHQTLSALDLSSEPLALAQAFVRGYLQFGADAPGRCAHLLHPQIVLVIHAAEPQLAFAGEWRGVEGITEMIRSAYSQFTPVQEEFGRWFVNGAKVAAMRNDHIRPVGSETVVKMWILHEYDIQGGLIHRIDNYIDSRAWSRFLTEHSAAEREVSV